MANENSEENLELYPTISEATANLLNNQWLADIQFQIGDQFLYAHSHELSKRSKVFRRQYEGTIGVMKLVIISNRTYAAFYEFLKYIYTDSCTINHSIAFELLKLALQYEILGLETSIRKFLIENIATENVLNLYEFCLAENYTSQINKIKNFISENMFVVIRSEQFLKITIETVIAILKLDQIDNVTREIDLCESAVRWVQSFMTKNHIHQDGCSKRAILNDALKHIRFPVMTHSEFSRFVQREPDLLTAEEINSICVCMTLRCRNTFGFSSDPRNVCINYSIGTEFTLNMRPFFGFESRIPMDVDSCFTASQNVILTSISIGVGSVPHNEAEVQLLNQTKQVLRHLKIRYNREKWEVGSMNGVFDLPYLLRVSQKYYLRIKYTLPSCKVNCIAKSKLQKVHLLNNKKVEIKFETLSPFLYQMDFREVK